MKVKSFAPPTFDEIPDVPREGKWVEAVLESRDRQLKHLTEILSQKVSAPENLNWEPKEIIVTDGVPVTVPTSVRGKPIGATLIASPSRATLTATPIDVGKIELTVDFQTPPGSSQMVTVMIHGV